METSQDKEWVCHKIDSTVHGMLNIEQATQYLLDPLNAPQPSEETGPGTSYNSTFSPGTVAKSSSQIEQEKRRPHVHARSIDHNSRSPPHSSSPRRSHFPHHLDENTPRTSSERTSSEVPTSSVHRLSSEAPEPYTHRLSSEAAQLYEHGHRRRGSSLTSRFPGDQSHRPLDIIRRESKKAHRSPHLRKDRHIGADSIDRLAAVEGSYHHHSGPYDPVSLARNQKHADSPIKALSQTNAEALKATPNEKVIDSIKRHRPLDGVAMTAPGMPGPDGRIMQYEEGSNMMVENGGNYKRWDGRVSKSFYLVDFEWRILNKHRNTTLMISKARASHPIVSKRL